MHGIHCMNVIQIILYIGGKKLVDVIEDMDQVDGCSYHLYKETPVIFR